MSSKLFKKFDSSQKTLSALNNLLQSLTHYSPSEFLDVFPKRVCEILSVPICIIWQKNSNKETFKIVSVAGKVDEDYKKTEFYFNHPAISLFFQRNRVLFLSDINRLKFRSKSLNLDYLKKNLEYLKQRKWISLLSVPIKSGSEKLGIITVFTTNKRYFKSYEKQIFNILASQVAFSFQKSNLLKEKENQDSDKVKSHKLTEIMEKMIGLSSIEPLLESLLKGSLELVSSAYGWIGRLNYYNGQLDIVYTSRELSNNNQFKWGIGATGKSLIKEHTIRYNDVSNCINCWPDTRSLISIPILIGRVPVRVGTKSDLGSKIFGVLNIESTNVKAFSLLDEERLWLLARFAAMLLDKLECDNKLDRLRLIEQKFVKKYNYGEIIKTVTQGITDILGFDFVNISLINHERTQIKSEFFFQKNEWSETKEKEFKKMAVHNLNSEDIQADIVRSRRIEVPSIEDYRFDSAIYKQFKHHLFIRVFIPMIQSTSNEVLGTVEVGYRRKYRKYIYERDVKILQNFVNYAAHALEGKTKRLIEQIIHEFKSPITGIRNNASFLQRRLQEFDRDYIDIKLGDILLDGEILLYQVAELEYIFGTNNSQEFNLKKTVVFRDVVIKTINQLKPTLREFKFSIQNIKYNPEDSRKIIIRTNPFKLNQVVYNLLTNSIKYAYKDPDRFQISIEVRETQNNFIIQFADYGIGIRNEDANKVFQERFRSTEAMRKDVNGSGLGLTISKNIMRQLGGDLILEKANDPTTFHIVLPKKIGDVE